MKQESKYYLSAIICTYNRAIFLPQVLESLKNQNYNKEKFEIIVVNNNSTDNTEEICLNFKEKNKELNFNYFVETNQGLSYARNRAIKESNGEILIFIDDDAIASEKYLEEIFNFFNKYNEISAGGGKILPKFETKKPKWMSYFMEPLMSVINLGDKIKEFPKNKYPIGANMFFKREVFTQAGDFNTNLGRVGKNLIGGEEKDIFNRLKAQNKTIYYLPDAWVYHWIPQSRLNSDFIKKQALGIGISEKIRAQNINNYELFKSFIKESLKWAASIFLFLYYFITLRISKGVMIIRFRTWVTKGLFSKQKTE